MDKELKNNLNWKEIGQRFRALRKQHGFDQTELVSMSGRRGNVARFEAGLAPASTNYALFLRNTFGASFDWLYDGVENLRSERDRTEKKIFNPHAIGARLKAIRLKMGLTQKEFGLLIGLSSVGVGNIENGHRTPEIKTALKIKRALNKTLDWIYFGDECIGTRNRVRPSVTTKPTIPLKQLKKELKEEAISYIKNMDERDLAMLTTRLRMEQKHNATLSTSTTKDSQLNSTQLNSTQLNSRSHQKKQKSSE
ncbi:hypothetical protein CKC_05830 [Candidatus Liberibacter solanacearum CLso-ZC1]|uniref:HTH cro/C1-type domain-containing protein n=1 Tax=Liberibacter solanacearum (strain CLso-ZC1) TaxID=658172 RepID=E4UE83_LIBSC|nr:helix-turn-helix transcriptional regulator [Candidatus Liberibacter solanacearum]ADR52911.1 hypothetical protein CKC_05830 [Candidatus Liberibacter solanacearum CLso-ZC1]